MATVERHGKSWRAVYIDAQGDRAREVVPARNKAEAKELAARLERRAWLQRRGLECGPEDLPGTLAEICTWWLTYRCPRASREGGATSGLQKHVIRSAIGKVALAALRASHLDELLHQLEAAGAAPATLNNLRAQLHVVFAKGKKAGRWVGDNPVDAIERRKVPKRIYETLTPDQLGRMLVEIPEDWRPLFACGPALGLRKGELFGLRKTDVDMARGTVAIARSHNRDTTKGGDAAVLPIPAPLRPWLEYQLEHAPGPLVFPAPDGSQRPREADPQKILRHSLARAGIVRGYEHRCRWCTHKEKADDPEPRFCPTCQKTTDGRGHPIALPRGRRLWPVALHVPMRFHDLRHTFATALLRAGVDVHRVQRLMRHSDVRVTTGTYGHLIVEDLRAAVDAQAFHLPAPPSVPETVARRVVGVPAPIEPHDGARTADLAGDVPGNLQKFRGKLERETGFEPATLSLGSAPAGWERSAECGKPSESLDARTVPTTPERVGLATLVTRRAPIEPQRTAQDARGDQGDAAPVFAPPRRLRALFGRAELLTVRVVAKALRVSTATVYGLIDHRELAHVRISNAIRIAPADLAAYLAAGGQRDSRN